MHNSYPVIDGSATTVVLMRGLPGSGKSTLARKIASRAISGISISADEYFLQNLQYVFDARLLSKAHEWVQQRVKLALATKSHRTIVIDNTNVEIEHMFPYCALAVGFRAKVVVVEVKTPWRQDAIELARRNAHKVTYEALARKLATYKEGVTSDSVLKAYHAHATSRRAHSQERSSSQDSSTRTIARAKTLSHPLNTTVQAVRTPATSQDSTSGLTAKRLNLMQYVSTQSTAATVSDDDIRLFPFAFVPSHLKSVLVPVDVTCVPFPHATAKHPLAQDADQHSHRTKLRKCKFALSKFERYADV